MKSPCANCRTEHNQNYCPNCGQKRVLRHTLIDVIRQFFMGIDIERGFFYTITLIMVYPRKLLVSYLDGKTKIYTNPVSLFVIVTGLTYLLDELSIVHGKALNEGQFIELLIFFYPSVITALILSTVPFFRHSLVEFLIVFLYYLTGVQVIILLDTAVEDYAWRYNWNIDLYNQFYMYFANFIYPLYYFLTVFKNKMLIKGFLTLIIFYGIMFLSITLKINTRFFIDNELAVAPELQTKLYDMPNWPKAKIYSHPYSALVGSDTTLNVRYLSEDFNGDGIRDMVFPVRVLVTGEQELVFSNYFDFEPLFSEHFCMEGLNFDSLIYNSDDLELLLYRSGSLNHVIVWDYDRYILK